MEYINDATCLSEFHIDGKDLSNKVDIEIEEINDIKEKRKWMNFFIKNYSGVKIGLNENMFGIYCRFFIAKRNGKSLGYIRITNKTVAYEKYCEQEVWCASDAFVKKAYRNQGVLYELINYVVKNCKVKILRAETKRLQRSHYYYKSLGFTDLFQIINSELSIAVQTDFVEVSNKRNCDLM